MSVQNYVAGLMQVMRPKLQELMEKSTTAAGLIKAGTEVYNISKQDFRMPLVVQRPADFGGFNLNGGNLGRGSGLKLEQLVQTYYPSKLGIELTLEAMYSTEQSKTSVVNAFKENMKTGMEEAQIFDDISFHNITGNQGQIGSVTSAAAISSNTQTLTMDANFGSQLVRMNMPVEVFNSTFATQRTAAGSPDDLPRVASFDPVAKTLVLNNINPTTNITASGVQNGDALVFQGAMTSGYTSATPAFRTGLYFYNTTTTSGTFLGLSRSTYPELNSNTVNGSSGNLVPMQGLQLKHKILQRRGEVPALKGLAHPAQIARMVEHMTALSAWMRGKSDGPIDVLPNVGNDITWCGIPVKADIRANRSRVDFINLKSWGRARLKDLDWLDIDGKKVFEARATNGGLAASILLYLIQVENFYCVDPGSQGFIHTLAIPSGY